MPENAADGILMQCGRECGSSQVNSLHAADIKKENFIVETEMAYFPHKHLSDKLQQPELHKLNGKRKAWKSIGSLIRWSWAK